MERKNTYFEETALSFLPHHLGEAVRRSGGLYRGNLSEIRLRRGASLALTAGSKSIVTPIRCTQDDMIYTVRALCGNSLYSHSETIKEGYICTDGGIRAGVCGRAVTEARSIISVADITSICIRIPHRVPGASDGICRIIEGEDFSGLIIYSPPGEGKTTALREIAARLAARPYNRKVAVIDTRFEICRSLGDDLTLDALQGYPRAKGMEIALRTLSPQLIMCDEIGRSEDSEAILESHGSGVPTVATVHGRTLEEVRNKTYMKKLFDEGVFSHAVGLRRSGDGFSLTVDKLKRA